MRKIILSVAASLDGYIARLDGGYDWIVMEQSDQMAQFFASVDTVLMGRKMYDLILQKGMPIFRGMQNFVFSRTRTESGEENVHFVSNNKRTFVDTLRHQPGKNIWLAGGGELIGSFLQAGLVDQVILGLQPVLLGEGVPLFPCNFPQTNLRLVDCKPNPRGVVLLTYDVVK